MEPSGIEPESCNRPFVGFGAVERQSRPQTVASMQLSRFQGVLVLPFEEAFIFILQIYYKIYIMSSVEMDRAIVLDKELLGLPRAKGMA
ncbi:hypothetical protein [uncultured Nostoc sp.]|uniref:hypothetical protein n=1 Tax=uncultured Nostoc sp. TaxID=340711 RepID=UPI0035CA6726